MTAFGTLYIYMFIAITFDGVTSQKKVLLKSRRRCSMIQAEDFTERFKLSNEDWVNTGNISMQWQQDLVDLT